MSNLISRRRFLEFMGHSALAASALQSLSACTTGPLNAAAAAAAHLPFRPLGPSRKDALSLADGFHSDVVISWGDPLNLKGERFGFNNDYLAFLPLDPADSFE